MHPARRYETALTWLQRYPAAEVERRLLEIIEAKRKMLRGQVTP